MKDPDGEPESPSDSSDSESDMDCFESCGTHSPGPEEDLGPSGPEAGELESMEAESASLGSSEPESSETESEDSSSSESESGDPDPFDMEARRTGSAHLQLERFRLLRHLLRLRGVRFE